MKGLDYQLEYLSLWQRLNSFTLNYSDLNPLPSNLWLSHNMEDIKVIMQGKLIVVAYTLRTY